MERIFLLSSIWLVWPLENILQTRNTNYQRTGTWYVVSLKCWHTFEEKPSLEEGSGSHSNTNRPLNQKYAEAVYFIVHTWCAASTSSLRPRSVSVAASLFASKSDTAFAHSACTREECAHNEASFHTCDTATRQNVHHDKRSTIPDLNKTATQQSTK
jgi:hypothetical protein